MFTQLMDYRKWFAERYFREGELLYLTILGAFLIIDFLTGSLWFYYLRDFNHNAFTYYMQQGLAVLALIKIFAFNRFKNWQEPALFFTVFLTVWVGCRYAKQNYFMYYLIFMYGAKDYDFRHILKLFFGLVCSALLITMAGALIGIVPNATITHGLGTNLRYAMGMVYTTDFAARIFYLCMTYVLLRRFKLSLPEKISMFIIIVWTYVVTDARLDTILMCMLFGSVVFYGEVIKLIKWLGNKGLLLVEIIGVAGIFGLSFFFNPHNWILAEADHVLSGRLNEGHIALAKYGIRAFGRFVFEQGNGGFHPHIVHYFFIDSSFIGAAVKNGGIAFVLLMILIAYATIHFNNKHAYPLVITVLLVVLSSIIDQHLSGLSFNIIFLATLANITAFTPKNGEVSMNW